MALNGHDVLAPGFKTSPYWWEAAPRPVRAERPLPRQADAVVIGSGFTGLSAALTLARGGRGVVVLEKEEPGFGASSRNAGYLGRTFKVSFGALAEKAGMDHALAVYRELQAAFAHVVALIEAERIDCALRRCGRLIVANTPRHYDEIARALAFKEKHLGEAYVMVPRAELAAEVDTTLYHGGAVIPDLCSIHPGLYHLGLLSAAEKAGAKVHARAGATAVTPRNGGFEVSTGRGSVRAAQVLVATNGYTGAATPALRRRVIPFRGFMIATEELAPDLADRLIPHWRTIHDWHHDIDFLRRSPDGKRLLFGGLTGTATDDLPAMARRLHARLLRILPQLAGTRISHAWSGFCAGTFDLYPHVGELDGLHYAMGYCFAGVPAGTYLGHKAALAMMGSPEARTAFHGRPFPTRWFYTGRPWFMPAVMAHYRRQDRLGDSAR